MQCFTFARQDRQDRQDENENIKRLNKLNKLLRNIFVTSLTKTKNKKWNEKNICPYDPEKPLHKRHF